MGITLSRFCTSWRDWLLLLLSEENEVGLGPAAKAINSISSGNGRTTQRLISFGTRNESVVEMIDKPEECSSSGEVTKQLQVSISFKKNGADTEIKTTSTMISVTGSFDEAVCKNVEMQSVPTSSSEMKLQRSFGSRRRVVLMDSQWWKLLESTELEMTCASSSSDTAKSKWYRAKVKAVRVGKGLSKNAVFCKLASQHWIEAVDPGHRYGHNLRYYHVLWRNSPSRESFFHWLNHGEGKDLNLDEICPRFKLHQQRVKYLSPAEREAYEVILEEGKFKYKQSNQLIDTTGDCKWIYVLSTSGTLYVGEKKKGLFHHSSFLAGGSISAAGRVLVENGVLKAITRQSGHYRPTEENFEYFLSFLKENNVDLKDVDMTCVDEAETVPKRDMPRNWSGEDLTHLVGAEQKVKILNRTLSKTVRIRSLPRKLSVILIPEKHHPFRSLSAPVCRCATSDNM